MNDQIQYSICVEQYVFFAIELRIMIYELVIENRSQIEEFTFQISTKSPRVEIAKP